MKKVSSKGSIPTADIKELLVYWSKTQSLVEKWHPNITVVNRSINLFNGNEMQHFRKIYKNRQKQMTLDRLVSREKSSGGNVYEPQLSTSRFQMKEG